MKQDSKTETKSQFALMKQRRFAPFFWTQFMGAFNDNVFKNGLLALITFNAAFQSGVGHDMMNNLLAGMFILPFFLFSALAGQLADKYDKARLIRYVKIFEIVIMTLAALCFYFQQVWGLVFLLFMMGFHSSLFGPVKYSIIPQHLQPGELVGGNALVESGTFVAILLGTITAGVVSQWQQGPLVLGILVILFAVSGWLASRQIPDGPAPDPTLKMRYNIFRESWHTVQFSRENKSVFLAIMGISWFWFLGAAYLTQIYNYAKVDLHGEPAVATGLLATFSIGIALGSLLCERFSGHKIELGLVPLGSIGLSIFGMDLFFHTPPPISGDPISIGAFLGTASSYRVLADFMLIGMFGGFYIVPLYAMVQERSEEHHRSRIIASINILNALFMVVSAAAGALFLGVMELSIPDFFMVLAIMNIVVAGFIYSIIPEFFMRFLIWIITHTMYRVKHTDLNKIPDEGPALLVCNHVSFMDALIIAGACRRPVRFVMFKPIYDMPVLNFIFRTGKTIPIHSKNIDPVTYEHAFTRISHELRDGEVVCLFPEGKLTTTGEIDEFKNGMEKILAQDPVTVVPMALRGLWGSFFSHKDSSAMTRLPRRFWSKVELVAGDPVAPDQANAALMREKVLALRGDWK